MVKRKSLRAQQVSLLIFNMKLKAKKSLGQNFLRDTEILNDIAEGASVFEGDLVLEVGPGEGDLTQALLGKGARVYGVEKDSRAIPLLEKKFQNEIASDKYSLIEGDALDVNPEDFFGASKPYKIVANIPYYITGLLIRHFLEVKHKPTSITLVVQKEVAERIATTKKESILSLSVKAYGNPHYIRTIEAKYFDPAPKVDSAILHISDISNTFFRKNPFSPTEFFKIIKLGFSQKRKTLIKNLSLEYPRKDLEGIFESLSLLTTIRAEQVSLNLWRELVLRLQEL
jgi:16S rRNA (adenine1518-N6/adenine1519-N6)-dimethyltransferase